MNLLDAYETAVKAKKIEDDQQQRVVIAQFQRLWDALQIPKPWFMFWRKPPLIKGIYLYGPVGGGKTWVMDLFYHALPADLCHRVHFHQFMQSIDAQLRQLQGQKNPIQHIAKRIAARVRVLCFDEFIVQDITQASVLVELLSGLFQRGVILVATSNTPPDELYLNGMNRARFLPAIALIHAHCEIVPLLNQKDYRMGHFISAVTYITPLGEPAEQLLLKAFHAQEPKVQEQGEICIQKRQIPYVGCGHHAIWFEFNVLCQIPRCQLDYLELSEKFTHFYVSNVPALKEDDTTAVLLLMYLVDVLYDKRRTLVLSAAVPLDMLYPVGPMLTEFERTKSRLAEMQSVDYLGFMPP
jgi:cell division protein ZapE